MEKIQLLKEERELLLNMQKSKGHMGSIEPNCFNTLLLLEQKGFVKNWKTDSGSILTSNLTDKARAYLTFNPKLKNPSIWDDKKYIINTVLSVTAIIISAVALYFSIKNN